MKCLKKYLFGLLWLTIVVTAAPPSKSDYDYENSSEEDKKPSCDDTNCQLPNCSCFGNQPKLAVMYRPQFVMLTFDDAITVANIETYRTIAKRGTERKPVRMTFFVCHEYNDYTLAHELYSEGHEIAVHSISHESSTELWRKATDDRWKKEMVGMRVMLDTFAGIPKKEVVGHRAPFLQTAGNTTFQVLQREGFLYDSSMPTRNNMDPPVWPYTLDHGYAQDCQIEPCPEGNFQGLWLVPMIQYLRRSQKPTEEDFYCSMVDACTPQPTTAKDTKEYLMENFLRHYRSNRAPFPVFLHEAWLKEEERLQGYLDFLDEILKMEGVYTATIRDVIEYMRAPEPKKHHPQFIAREQQPSKLTCEKKEVCSYKQPLRIMKSCTPCSKYYPWVGTPLGKRSPIDFPNME
ncbi:hypothetical protein JTE90_007161 [Oedothorax gibbosus]|uniref:NodB homology domain-containing protein n=1 Tax=Oedothorax gibbosus TaxID=931172 RepID=A0AAV6UXJ8_9ARAC|nr:hypothetical protein JTE90_007161 [Oedothorax gibbosus]